jgi:hypothetical protein
VGSTSDAMLVDPAKLNLKSRVIPEVLRFNKICPLLARHTWACQRLNSSFHIKTTVIIYVHVHFCKGYFFRRI